MNVIGLRGKAAAGKDTAAAYLVGKGFVRVAFADAVKREAAEAYGVTLEWLNNRDTKEKDTPVLALERCRDLAFVQCAVAAEKAAAACALDEGSDVAKVLAAPRSPRWVLQRWGTEYRRAQAPDYWIDQVLAQIKASPDVSWVVSDVRNENELNAIDALGGQVFEVVMRGAPENWGVQGAGVSHVSETALDLFEFPVLVNQFGDSTVLYSNVERAILENGSYRG